MSLPLNSVCPPMSSNASPICCALAMLMLPLAAIESTEDW